MTDGPTIYNISLDMDIVSPAKTQLVCEAQGNPKPTVYWFFGDHIISEEMPLSNYLTLDISSFEESGYYTCIAKNRHNSTSKSLRVTVQGRIISYIVYFNDYRF